MKPTITPGGAIEDAAPIQQSVLGLAASLVALFFVFRLIHGLITGQAGQNLRATVVDLPMVIVGTLFFGFLCYTLLTIVDEFSDPLINDYASTLNTTVGELYSQDGIVQGGVFVIIFALLYIVAAVFLCFELFVRSSLIYLVVMFAPLAIATRIWGPTRSYARRATETAVALIFSKLAIAVTLATGASLMTGPTETGGNVAMIQGSAILLLAAFMPFALMRVIPMMEGAVAGEGVARTMGMKAAGGAVAAGGAAQLASKPISSAASRVRGRSGSGGGPSSSDGSETGGDAQPPAGGPGGASGNPPSGGPKPTPNGPGGDQASNPATTTAGTRSAAAMGTTGSSGPREANTPALSSQAPTPAASGSTSASAGSTHSASDTSVATARPTASTTMSGASTGSTPPQPVVSTAESFGTSPIPPSSPPKRRRRDQSSASSQTADPHAIAAGSSSETNRKRHFRSRHACEAHQPSQHRAAHSAHSCNGFTLADFTVRRSTAISPSGEVAHHRSPTAQPQHERGQPMSAATQRQSAPGTGSRRSTTPASSSACRSSQLVVGCTAALIGALLMVFVSVPIGALVVVAFGGLALARHSGEPVLHQLPTVARLARQGTKPRTWFEPLPLLGPTTNPKKLPPALARQELLTVDPATYGVDIDGPVAIVREQKAGIYAITLRIAGRQFGLSEPHAQDFQLAQWGRILQGFVSEHPSIASGPLVGMGIASRRRGTAQLARPQPRHPIPARRARLVPSACSPISTPPQHATKYSSPSRPIRPECGCKDATAATATGRSSKRSSPRPDCSSADSNKATSPPEYSTQANGHEQCDCASTRQCRSILDDVARTLGNDAAISPDNILPTSIRHRPNIDHDRRRAPPHLLGEGMATPRRAR